MLALLTLACTENALVVYEGLDVFYQEPAEQVDILLVIDDSCSMRPYQEALSTTFGEFMRFLAGAEVQWRIGVVSTDVRAHQGQLDGFLSWEDSEAEERFAEAVSVGVEGSGTEMGLEAAAITLGEDGSGFVRDEARFSAIFVSDEEDSSPLSVAEYIRDLEALKGARSRDTVNASALVALEGSACGNEHSRPGDRYVEAARQTDGVVGDLCAADLAPVVAELSLVSSRQTDTFALSEEPAVGTLRVSVDEVELPCEEGAWSFQRVVRDGVERPSVVFSWIALPGAHQQVAVRYLLGDGDPAAFCPAGGPT